MQKIILILLTSITLLISSCGLLPVVGVAKALVTTNLDRRTVGVITDDDLIDLELETWAVGDDKFKDSHFNFNVYNKNLLITGEVENDEVRKYLIEQINRKQRVNKIFDEAVIAKPSSFFDRSSDSIIDGKIKLELNNQEVFNPVHINYHTERGVVYLLGDVTEREGKKAGVVIAGVSGVKKVVKYFNYIENIPQREIDRAITKRQDLRDREESRQKNFNKQQRIDKLKKQIEAINNE
jgi:osmotically-inducible protein OsmY